MLTSNINPPDVFYVQLNEQLDVGGASGFPNLIFIYWTNGLYLVRSLPLSQYFLTHLILFFNIIQ